MSKILIYEYITGGGLINEDLTSTLLHEATLISSYIYQECEKSQYFEYDYFQDYRIKDNHFKKAIKIKSHEEIFNIPLLKKYDYILPIAPEIDLNLFHYAKFLEKHKFNFILSDSKTIKLLSDKLLFYKECKKNNIPTIKTSLLIDQLKQHNKIFLVKDRYGAGCSYIKIIKKFSDVENNNFDKIVQPYINGEHYSLCLFFNKNNYNLLTINKQKLEIDAHNMMKLVTLHINVSHHFHPKITSLIFLIMKSFPGLRGYVGIDIIIHKGKIFVVEINPRVTTSFIGIYETIGVNIIDLIINSKYKKNVISGKSLLFKT